MVGGQKAVHRAPDVVPCSAVVPLFCSITVMQRDESGVEGARNSALLTPLAMGVPDPPKNISSFALATVINYI